MEGTEEGTDASSIKPVSSLRSRFENLQKDNNTTPLASPIGGRSPFLTATTPPTTSRPSTSAGESNVPEFGILNKDAQTQPFPRKRRPSPPNSRPHSMVSVTPSQKSPPLINVDSPSSPERGTTMSIDLRVSNFNTPQQPLTPALSNPDSPTKAHARTLSRATTPALEARMSALLQQSNDSLKAASHRQAAGPPTPEIKPKEKTGSVPPPVNRAGKPKVPIKPTALANALGGKKPEGLSVPEPTAAELTDQSVSPFNTPPGSGTSSPRQQNPSMNRVRNDSDASFVERLRGDSDASLVGRIRTGSDTSLVERVRADSSASSQQRRTRGDSEASFVERARAGSNASFVEPSSLPESHYHFQPPPIHHHVATRRDQQMNGLPRAGTMPARYRPVAVGDRTVAGDLPDERPRLPSRPELQMRSGRTSPTKIRSGRTSPLKQEVGAHRSAEALHRADTLHEQHTGPPKIPASKPIQRSALAQGFDRTMAAPPANASHIPPAVPAPRRSVDRRRDTPPPEPKANGHSRDDEEDTPPVDPSSSSQPTSASDYPDSSRASRRPPRYKQRPWHIPTEYDTRTFAVCGEYVCTTGHHTKAWDLRSGEQLLHMPHTEIVKVSSVVFKPATEVENEGKRIWLGTSIGEIHEVDIPTQTVVKTKANAHVRREIIRMFRYASELWTLDDGGDLNVWKPDHKGMPSLDSQYSNFRTPRGHTFSIALGPHLWIATGKELRVFAPSAKSDGEFQVIWSPLSQPGTGEIHSGTTLSGHPELVYFGHQDGKVSIYNRQSFACVSVVNVSMYKLSSLTGVGDYLWAGFSTGMAYVYDTSTTPWTVMKDWRAHEKQICGINADPSALWKMDRLQVVTLGTDNMIRIWDGMLEEDWLDTRMQVHDSEYCTFQEITAAVLTWNAGASKPTYLSQNKEDNNFFREYVAGGKEPPDIFVFGFQELVDLEDKKVTAKTFFKSKKKDASEGQDHMSHQYRAWRDYLTRCIEEYIPSSQSYVLLHTASLVGLFTCIFVKASLRSRIRHVHTAEVKTGMGGRYGNKGALVLRCVLDDSSLCFVNCHLAAGQTQTMHRNNDIAAILETEALPSYPLTNEGAQHADVFTSGGDGSMILDHEICILNGDLNYRIDTMGRDTVVKHIYQNNLARLLERDQLLLSRRKNPGFRLRAFQESPITFAPTYKYNLHSDDYDSSEKRRSPAWCDRVLYRGLGKVRMEEYRRWEVRISDHRPVSGRLRLRVKRVDEGRRERVWRVVGEEFEEVRLRVRKAVQLGYLTNVLGLSHKEASTALKG